MTKPARQWIVAQSRPKVLVPHGHAPAIEVPCLQIRVARRCLGAELVGPWMLLAAIRLPAGAPQGERAAHACAWMGALHARWLGYMGVAGASTYGGPVVPHWAAFAGRHPGDVLVGPRKIVAVSAMRRPCGTVVFASTLLRQPPWALLCRTLGHSWEEIPVLAAAATNAGAELHDAVDEERWANSLRSMLQLSLALPQPRSEGGEGATGFMQACQAR